jgi:hypothetical protein
MPCIKAGCVFHHLTCPRMHGHCCNACKEGGASHTRNCSGFRQAVIVPPCCSRVGCPFQHRKGERWHGFCCNACRKGNTRHTRNCTGTDELVLAAAPRSSTIVIETLWRVPLDWTCWALDPLSGIYCYRCSLHFLQASFAKEMRMCATSTKVVDAWRSATDAFDQVRRGREICLSAYATSDLPQRLPTESVDLCSHFKPDGRPQNHEYEMKDVTGLDRAVMCTLILQEDTANALTWAVRLIESDDDLSELAFTCKGGTHRSVACACLLSMLAYPNARIRLTTRRTIEAAHRVLDQVQD